EKAKEIGALHQVSVAASIEQLLDEVDAVDIVTPTSTHFEIGMQAIARGKHVFLEKPITETVEQAHTLTEAASKHGVKVQVGHIERFNPAIVSLNDLR